MLAREEKESEKPRRRCCYFHVCLSFSIFSAGAAPCPRLFFAIGPRRRNKWGRARDKTRRMPLWSYKTLCRTLTPNPRAINRPLGGIRPCKSLGLPFSRCITADMLYVWNCVCCWREGILRYRLQLRLRKSSSLYHSMWYRDIDRVDNENVWFIQSTIRYLICEINESV